MSVRYYHTSFLRQLASRDVTIYEQLLLFARNQPQFLANVSRLQKPALEAMVYVLILELNKRNTSVQSRPEPQPIIGLREVLELIEQNHLYLQKNEECLGLLLNILGLVAALEEDDGSCCRNVELFVNKFQKDLFELPLFYDILRTLLMVALEKEQLQQAFHQLNIKALVRNLYSESHQIRMKSLACLQLLMNRQGVIEEWHRAIVNGRRSISQEHCSFMLCHLIEALIQRKDCNDSIQIIIQSLDTWKIIKSNCKSKDQLIRKEAMSVIKNILAFLNDISEYSTSNDLFEWNNNNARSVTEAWQCYVTIVETLNETQTHLVMPALPLIEKLGVIPVDWKHSVLELILTHDNSAVAGYGIDYLLRKSKFDGRRQLLEEGLLLALNKTTVFQDFNEMKRLLVQYFSGKKGCSFLLSNFKNASWGSVPFMCLLEVLDCLLESTTEVYNLNESINSLVAQSLAIKNLNIRGLASLQLSRMLLKLTLRKDLSEKISVVEVIFNLNTLSRVTKQSFSDFSDWNQLVHLIDGESFQWILSKVDYSDENVIRDVIIPYVQENPLLAEHRLKQIYDQDLLLAIRIQRYGDLLFDINELTCKLEDLLMTFNQNSETTLKSLDIYKELVQNTHLSSLVEHQKQKLIDILQKRIDRLSYHSPGIAITVQLVHIVALLNRVDVVDQFLASFTLEELIKTIHTDNRDKSLYGSVFNTLSDIFLLKLKNNTGNLSTELQIIEDYPKLIDIGDVHVLFNTLEIVAETFKIGAKNLNVEKDFDDLKSVVDRCYKEILIYRKSDHFMKLMKTFVITVLTPFTGSVEFDDGCSRWLKDVVTEYFLMFLEQATVIGGLANVLFEKVLLLSIETLLEWNAFGKLLLEGLVFGDGQKREQRIEDETCVASQFFDTLLYTPTTPLQSDARVRILCVLFLYRLARTNHPDVTLFLLKLERMLVEKFQQITKSKERYYADSQTHRHKLRIIQALCVVVKLTGTKPYSLLEIVLYETNQPNINYLIELILADSSIDTLTIINSLKNDKVKVSGVQSVFVILWLRCCKTNYLDAEYINFLLPWTMAQNFSTRLYAQITISKLLEKFYEKPNRPDQCPFSNIFCAINSYLKQGNVEKNLEKCMKDFRFNSIFDYDNLLTLENVFNNIPRVSRMASEDVVSTKVLKECFEVLQLKENNLGVAVEFDELTSEKKENLFLNQGFGGSDHIQKKIVPLKCLEPALELLTNLPEKFCLKKKDNLEGMIVVASLVNRPPNLGGLARSSEIFAVTQFIVNSLKDLENKEFQALSMTAEKWLNIGELKSFQIVDYLLEMKSKGYSIVGAEQTTGSRPIQKIKFPKRSILVLGHEKEGLPAQIISHLDIIVEIPQFGVVRSLNVHVTGAIFMWEYAKQHHVIDC